MGVGVVYGSFNSQRDGILLKHVRSISMAHIGFNSQRDGILPKSLPFVPQNNEFQFPTGWNSTLSYRRRRRSYWRFNSQRDGILQFRALFKADERICFNSQRDGILLAARAF